MVDLDNDKDKIIIDGNNLWNQITQELNSFYSEKVIACFFTSRKVVKKNRKRLNNLKHSFRGYVDKVNNYINEIAFARNLHVRGKQEQWTPDDRTKAHIFSEQLLNQQNILFRFLEDYTNEINDFELQINNKRLILATYAMLGVTVLLFIISLMELIN